MSRFLRLLLAAHALGVVAGLAYYAVAVIAHGDAPDANLGEGLALLWLTALGSPWAWPVWQTEDVFGPFGVLAIVGSAVVNLLLHAAAQLTWRSRPSQ